MRLGRAYLLVLLLAFLGLLFIQSTQTAKADVTVEANVTNVCPTVSSTSATAVTNPETGTTTLNVTLSDDNGGNDIGTSCTASSRCNVTCWGATTTELACTSDTGDCRYAKGLANTSSCASGTSCSVLNSTFGFLANSTNGTWTCRANVTDINNCMNSSSTFTFSMSQYAMCTITEQTSCGWASQNPNSTSAAASNTYSNGVCVNLTNTGNTALKILTYSRANNLTCSSCNGNPTNMSIGYVYVKSSSGTSGGTALSSSSNATVTSSLSRGSSSAIFFYVSNSTDNSGLYPGPFAAGTFANATANQLATYCDFASGTGTYSSSSGWAENSNMPFSVPVSNLPPDVSVTVSPDLSTADPGTTNTMTITVTDKNGGADLDNCASSGCNITCWSASTGESYSESSWDVKTNTSVAVSAPGATTSTSTATYTANLEETDSSIASKPLNGTWNCRVRIKDKTGSVTNSELKSSVFTVNVATGSPTASTSTCGWSSLTPNTNNNIANTGCTGGSIDLTHGGNTNVNYYALGRKTAGDCYLKPSSGAGTILISNITLNGHSTCSSGTGRALNGTTCSEGANPAGFNYPIGYGGGVLSNIPRGTGTTSNVSSFYECISVPVGTPVNSYSATLIIQVQTSTSGSEFTTH